MSTVYIYIYTYLYLWIDGSNLYIPHGLVRQLGALQGHAHAADAREELQHAERSEASTDSTLGRKQRCLWLMSENVDLLIYWLICSKPTMDSTNQRIFRWIKSFKC